MLLQAMCAGRACSTQRLHTMFAWSLLPLLAEVPVAAMVGQIIRTYSCWVCSAVTITLYTSDLITRRRMGRQVGGLFAACRPSLDATKLVGASAAQRRSYTQVQNNDSMNALQTLRMPRHAAEQSLLCAVAWLWLWWVHHILCRLYLACNIATTCLWKALISPVTILLELAHQHASWHDPHRSTLAPGAGSLRGRLMIAHMMQQP